MTVQGKSISISSSEGLAAIDTGTTLIGAPSTVAQQIWANVPGSVALSGQNQGMYAFRKHLQLAVIHTTHSILFDAQHAAPSLTSPFLSVVPTGPSALLI